jgi:hypothetical protein
MSNFKELTFKDISYIRAALEGFIGQLKMNIESGELDDVSAGYTGRPTVLREIATHLPKGGKAVC